MQPVATSPNFQPQALFGNTYTPGTATPYRTSSAPQGDTILFGKKKKKKEDPKKPLIDNLGTSGTKIGEAKTAATQTNTHLSSLETQLSDLADESAIRNNNDLRNMVRTAKNLVRDAQASTATVLTGLGEAATGVTKSSELGEKLKAGKKGGKKKNDKAKVFGKKEEKIKGFGKLFSIVTRPLLAILGILPGGKAQIRNAARRSTDD